MLRSNRLALLLGVVAISLTCVIGLLAFRSGRGRLEAQYTLSTTHEVDFYATLLDSTTEGGVPQSVLDYIARHFETKQQLSNEGAELVVYDEHGAVLLDTARRQAPGAGQLTDRTYAQGVDVPSTIGEVCTRSYTWSGYCRREGSEHSYLASFGRALQTHALVGYFLPAENITLELDRASIPWMLGMALVALVLMPLALLMLNRSYVRSVVSLASAQESLRESEARLSAAIESLPCEFTIHGPDGRIVLQNAEAVKKAGRMEGRTLAEGGLGPELVQFWAGHCARALKGESFEIEYERREGSTQRHFHAIVGPVRSAAGTLGVSVLEFDLTERKRTERALAHAHRELDFHFENSPLALIEWDPQMRVRRWSKGAERIFGWRAEEVLGRDYSEFMFVHPGDFGRVAQVVGELMRGVAHASSENRNLTQSGDTLHCQWFNSAFSDASGRVLSVLSICQDVSARVRADGVQRMHRLVFGAMLEQRSEQEVLGILIRSLDELIPGALCSVLLREPGAARLRNCAAPALPAEYLDAIDGLPIGDGEECGVCGRACHTRQPVIIADLRQEPSLRRFLPVFEPHGLRALHSYPILAMDGSALGSFAFYFQQPRQPRERERGVIEEAVDLARVVVEYTRAQREQAQMNSRVSVLHDIGRQILETGSVEDVLQYAVERLCESLGCLRASVLLVDRDANGNIERLHLAAAGGAARLSQPVGTTFEPSALTPEEMQCLLRGETLVRADLGVEAQSRAALVALEAHGVRSMVQSPMISHGRLVGTLNLAYPTLGCPPEEALAVGREAAFLLGVAVEQQRLNEALRQHAFELERRVLERTEKLLETNVEMETYVHTVTHDLRAPLRSIQGFGRALVEDHLHELGPMAREYVERMVAGAERMEHLMRELLAYSRLGHTELHMQGVDLSAIEREAENLISSELRQSSAELIVEGPLGEVRGHTPTLVQVVANLLSNAAKFVPKDRRPQIKLRREQRGPRLRLWIEDNGIGVPLEAQERIWGVFERLHGTDSYPGTGLGLAIVRRALGRMHGSCGVESDASGGSRFWIELDALETAAGEFPSESSSGPSG
ncbi:MAG: PAS domain S-box protein [Planctomycetes bacterium]|nr:PAS domain S-box protein [Planctomycetota bacterium]